MHSSTDETNYQLNPLNSLLLKCTHRVADRCEFQGMKDELIRDRLVARMLDRALSQRLQMEADLSLDKAKRQHEAVKTQQETLQGKEKEETLLHDIAKHPPRRKQHTTVNWHTSTCPSTHNSEFV